MKNYVAKYTKIKEKNLKYDFPEITKALKDLGINTKFVW